MPSRLPRILLSCVALFAVALPAGDTDAYVGRCPTCGTVDRVDAIAYTRAADAPEPAVGAIIGSIDGREGARNAAVSKGAPGGLIGRKLERKAAPDGTRGTRLEVRMDKGGIRTIEVHGDPRIYRGDRVKVSKGRVELL